MTSFLTEEFLLNTETARRLYHRFAEPMPIIDYHCHLSPQEIFEDRHYDNLAQHFLGENGFGDHYKWRLMRANGVPEELVTGKGPDRERFQAFAEMLPKAIGNPMVHWTHLELKRYFGWEGFLSGETAQEIWDLANEKLKTMSVRDMIRMSKVELLCTTDDPADDLAWHRRIAEDESFEVKVLPAWRPERVIYLEKPDFADYLAKLGAVSGVRITDLASLKEALKIRLAYFAERGCRVSDHGMDAIPFADLAKIDPEAVLQKAMRGEAVTEEERKAYQFEILRFLGREYARLGWMMQLHYGPMRNVNSRMYEAVGADAGFDCMGAVGSPQEAARFLDSLEQTGELPKTVLYSLNPADTPMLIALAQSFQSGMPGKIQLGAAWWFNDTFEGMSSQLKTLAEGGLLGNFIGMLTDSRSFLSYTRHEYFRRLLCRIIGQWVEEGMYPNDDKILGEIIEGICVKNVRRYL
ncbi:MAG: glucuronate isomerase [Lachnospiraceae bacterium]|nr:glucuronate isomerase [Lachnospiraceae bacterium]